MLGEQGRKKMRTSRSGLSASFYLLCKCSADTRKVKAQKGAIMWKVGGRAEIRTKGPDPVSLNEGTLHGD